MIYFISNQQILFENTFITHQRLSSTEILNLIDSWKYYQFDLETSGNDPHISNILSMQIGNIDKSIQIVIDCTTIDFMFLKSFLEDKSRVMIGQNLKFDLQFLYKHNITPINCYDTMIVEQLLYLGYPYFLIGASEDIIEQYHTFIENYDGYSELKPEEKKLLLTTEVPQVADFIYNHSGVSLKALAHRYCNATLDKTIRGEINWRGLDERVIKYAADDVVYLYDIMQQQLQKCKEQQCVNGAQLECSFVPVIAYLEWCGIKLDEQKWKSKMEQDLETKKIFEKTLNSYIINSVLSKPSIISYIKLEHREEEEIEKERKLYKNSLRVPSLDILNKYEAYEVKLTKILPQHYIKIDTQGDLFLGFNTEAQCTINWDSSQQVIPLLNLLGFNTKIIDKKSKEEKDSALEKVLSKQKGINDIFLTIYLNYKEADKVCTTYGQAYLNAINPITGRIHTNFRQLGANSGRMACGSQDINIDLAKLKHLPLSTKKGDLKAAYPQLQNLPADEKTRSAFVAEKGNLFASGDFAALESRLGADIYNEPAMIEEYLYGSGDIHSLVAKACFPEELANIPVKEIKKKRPDLRKKAKAPEFNADSY